MAKTLHVNVPFNARKWQREALDSLAHRTVLNVHRGGGKTVLCVVRLIIEALTGRTKSGIPARYGYCGKSISHAKQTVWHLFKWFLKDFPAKMINWNAQDLTIEFPNGNSILLSGIDDPDKVRGQHFSGLVLDEAQLCTTETWEMVLGPTLRQNKGFTIIIGTPNGPQGMFYEYTRRGLDPENKYWTTLTYTVDDTGEIDPEEWQEILANYAMATIRQEYYCDFNAQVSNRVYYNFDARRHIPAEEKRRAHVDPHLKDRGDKLFVGMDFNTALMPAVIAQKSADGKSLEVFDEIIQRDTTTDRMALALKTKYPGREITILPDASGASNTTASIRGSDHDLLRQAGLRVVAPERNPPVDARIKAINVLLENALGERRMFVHPRCTETIRTLTFHQINAKTGDPEKSKDIATALDHAGDALGYLVNMVFPLKKPVFKSGKLKF